MNPQFRRDDREKGQAIVLLVLLMVGLIGAAALAVDGGRLYQSRRRAQNGADNAALAGARAICYSENVTTKALAVAAQNGFNNDGTTNTVTVTHPLPSGPYAGNNEFVRVSISSTSPTAFAQLVYSGGLHVTTRALARCEIGFEYAVVALDTSVEVRGFELIGNGDITVVGGGVMVNSSHPTQALYEIGTGSSTAYPIDVAGGYSGDGFVPALPNTGKPPIPDPLASLPPPPKPPGPCINANYSGSGIVTLDPGLYCQIEADANVQIVLNPGIYYIDGPGGLKTTANGSLTGAGVMFYLSPTALLSTPSNTVISVTGNGPVTASAPTSGTYKGVLVYVDRSNCNKVDFTGNGSFTVVGTIYTPCSELIVYGNAGSTSLDSMIIAKTIDLGGNGNVIVNYNKNQNYSPVSIVLVQ